ncbi:MAG: hypothetical protein M3M94_00445 [Actinomycetota bacterium]|nr:hypothetical protein [Actinomycetota bacterium]
MNSDAFAHDRFMVEQRGFIHDVYTIFPLGPGDVTAGDPVAYVAEFGAMPTLDLRFFSDRDRTVELFRLRARARIGRFTRMFDLTGADGTCLAVFERPFGRWLFRTTWRVLEADDRGAEMCVARERKVGRAVLRRLVRALRIPIPYDFDILLDGRRVGGVDRKRSLRDRYVVDVAQDADRRIDRRVAAALAVTLDAGQRR